MSACFLISHNVLSVMRGFLTSCYFSASLPAAAEVSPAQKNHHHRVVLTHSQCSAQKVDDA